MIILYYLTIIVGLVSLYAIFPTAQYEFNMWVYMTLPIAQPILILVMVILLYPTFNGVIIIWNERFGHLAGFIWMSIWGIMFLWLLLCPSMLVARSPNIIRDSWRLSPKPRFYAHQLGGSLVRIRTQSCVAK